MSIFCLHVSPAARERLRQTLGVAPADWLSAGQEPPDLELILAEAAPDQVRAWRGRRPETPVIVVAEAPDGAATRACFQAGASDVLTWDQLADLPAAAAHAAATARAAAAAHIHRQLADLAADFAYVLEPAPAAPVWRLTWLSENLRQAGQFAVGQRLSEEELLNAFHPDDHHRLRAHVQRLLAGQPDSVEARLRPDPAGQRWLRQIARPELDAAGRVVRVYAAAPL